MLHPIDVPGSPGGSGSKSLSSRMRSCISLDRVFQPVIRVPFAVLVGSCKVLATEIAAHVRFG